MNKQKVFDKYPRLCQQNKTSGVVGGNMENVRIPTLYEKNIVAFISCGRVNSDGNKNRNNIDDTCGIAWMKKQWGD